MTVLLEGFKLGRAKKTVIENCKFCNEVVKSLGMCSKHYQRYKRYGDPLKEVKVGRPKLDRTLNDSITVKVKHIEEEVKNNSNVSIIDSQNQVRVYPEQSKASDQKAIKEIINSPKTAGIVRCVDQLGRIVIPREYGTSKDIRLGDNLEFFVDGEQIALRKYSPGCIFCGNVEKLISYKNKLVCNTCIMEAKSIVSIDL